MSQNFFWPPSGGSSANASIAPNGQNPAATSSTLVAGINPSGAQQPLQTSSDGSLLVAPDPASTGNVNLTEVGGAAITLGQKTESASLPVVISSDQSAVHTIVDSSALPTGASTSALQTSGNNILAGILLDQTNGTQITQVSNFPATQPVSGTVTVIQPTGSNLHVDVDASVLPTGAATESSLSFIVTSSQQAANNTAALTLAPGASTAGSLGPMVLGAVTTAAPTYANGQVDPISLTTAGSLRSSITDSALPTGASTSANQTTGNTSLASIVTNTTGLATSANQTNGTQKSQAATPTPGTITQAAKSVGLTAVRLTVSGSAPSSTRSVLVVTPDSASTATFYIGGSTVASGGGSRGAQIVAGQTFIANNDAGDYYIIASSASQTVEIMEQA